ncbi:hypothetical protein ABE85_09900 [Mitsuaria sp. 7]|nr:hypothetical protein ABE85_09900 [Mitsuaria sp. 7]
MLALVTAHPCRQIRGERGRDPQLVKIQKSSLHGITDTGAGEPAVNDQVMHVAILELRQRRIIQ